MKTDDQMSFELSSPIHRLECLRVVDEIIDCLDERGLIELMQGTEHDTDTILGNLLFDTYDVLYTGNKDIDFAPRYQERLSETIEDVLRQNSLTYFITSVMPDFQLGWHHLEWGDLTMLHKKLCVIAARDHGKCEAVGTKVRMFDGTIKTVESLKVGDLLMGVDSKPRRVQKFGRGWDDNMYEIKQTKGDPYTVNSQHICTLIKVDRNGEYLQKRPKVVIDVDIPTLLSYSNNYVSECLRGFKVAYEVEPQSVLIEPYFLGYWLGDGNNDCQLITTADDEVVEYLENYADRIGMLFVRNGFRANIKRKTMRWKSKNILNLTLKSYDLLNNKHIPYQYIQNSKKVRLELLAGLLDSDGDLYQNGYHFSNINKRLVEDVKNLADSLGFRTYMSGGVKFNKQLGRMYETWGVSISGKIDQIPVKIQRKKIKYDWENKPSNKDWGIIDGIEPSVVSAIKIKNVGRGEYVSITTDGDRRFLLADGTVTHNSYYFSNAYAAWKLYNYSPPHRQQFSIRPSDWKSNRGYLFSFSLQQAVDLMEILKGTIETNDILRERLYPKSPNEGAWASTNINCKNGARLTCKGFGSSVRGAHPYWIVVDDGLKDNVIYSSMQRQKSTDYFHSVIMNMLVPNGQIIVVGTPFHHSDLYGDLRSKKGWFTIEYPAIFPNGKILWPQRWTFRDLMDKKETQGNLIFSRENLCRPIISESSIFPINILERSTFRMDTYTLVQNRDDFPMKFSRVVSGWDFAISGAVGADYTTGITLGIDDMTQEMWLMNFIRKKGIPYDEQIQLMKNVNIRFRPDVFVLEQNNFQQIFVQESDKQGLPVVGHTTGVEKNDLKHGWPGLAISFERSKFHIPVGDKESRDVKDLIFSELGNIAFTDKGICSVSEHDDIGSALWLAKIGASISVTGFKFSFL